MQKVACSALNFLIIFLCFWVLWYWHITYGVNRSMGMGTKIQCEHNFRKTLVGRRRRKRMELSNLTYYIRNRVIYFLFPIAFYQQSRWNYSYSLLLLSSEKDQEHFQVDQLSSHMEWCYFYGSSPWELRRFSVLLSKISKPNTFY